MDKFKRTLSLKKKKDTSGGESSKPHQWQEDERKVREGSCSFQVKYLGCIEVFESRGIQVCEDAVKALKNKKSRSLWSRISIRRKKKKDDDNQQSKSGHHMAVLYVTGDALRVVDEISKGLIVDQTIEKVSFCAPDRNHEKGFAYICRDGTTRRWMCHGFLAVKESGERLSHAVGCAFAICLEKKQQREKEKVTVTFNDNGTSFSRMGSFRQATMTERLTDPQSAILAEPIPTKPTSNPYAVRRPHAPVDILERQGSFRSFNKLAESSPFKRNISLRLNELPSNLERQKGFSGGVDGPQGNNIISTIMESEESDPFSTIPNPTSDPSSHPSSLSSSPLHNTFANMQINNNPLPNNSIQQNSFTQQYALNQQNMPQQQQNILEQQNMFLQQNMLPQQNMLQQLNALQQQNMLQQQSPSQKPRTMEDNMKEISPSSTLKNTTIVVPALSSATTSALKTLASAISQQQQQLQKNQQIQKQLQQNLQQKQEQLQQQKQKQLNNSPQQQSRPITTTNLDTTSLLNQMKQTQPSTNIFDVINQSLPITQSNPWAGNGTNKLTNETSEAEQWLNSTANHIDPFAAAPNVMGLKNQQQYLQQQLQQPSQQLLAQKIAQQQLQQQLLQQQLMLQQQPFLTSLANNTMLTQPIAGFQSTPLTTMSNGFSLQQQPLASLQQQPQQLQTTTQQLITQQLLSQQPQQQSLQQLKQHQKIIQPPLTNLTLQQQIQHQQLLQIQQQLQHQIHLQELKQLELQLQLQQQQKCKTGPMNNNNALDSQTNSEVLPQFQENQINLEINKQLLQHNLQQQQMLGNNSSQQMVVAPITSVNNNSAFFGTSTTILQNAQPQASERKQTMEGEKQIVNNPIETFKIQI